MPPSKPTPPSSRPPSRPAAPPPPESQQSVSRVSFSPLSSKSKRGQRIAIYGTGGIGKTSLACQLPGVTVFIDADESLAVLRPQLEQAGIELPQTVPGVTDWKSLRETLNASGWDGVNNIVIDTVTKAEEWATAYTLKTVKNEAGNLVSSVEGYGYGKGFQFVFDTFIHLLADLDRHVREGRNVVLIAHECTTTVPNPSGVDWLRYEPRLQSPSSGKASIRLRLKEWVDQLLFISYDVNVEKSGKAQGSGTRTLYPAEMPFCMAKSRTSSTPLDVTHGGFPWSEIIGQ